MLAAIRIASIVFLAAALASCAPPVGPSRTMLQHRADHFVFHFTEPDRLLVLALATRLTPHVERITRDLDAAGLRPVEVFFYDTHDALARAVEPIVGPIPDWATGLVTSSVRMHLLSPSTRGLSEAQAESLVLHEFTHCATLHVRPSSANNPRWLWETVALFEAGEWVDPRTLPYLGHGSGPTLAELNRLEDPRIYDVGFVLGEFIVSRGGMAMLRDLVKSGAQLDAVLGLSEAEFERDWLAFLRVKYSVAPAPAAQYSRNIR